ncbi:MAG: NADP-dependent oxidoreductase [Actinomycetota bacterium]|nr:NADP-dependent oxidoreductase [Actinomycetota bacterium]
MNTRVLLARRPQGPITTDLFVFDQAPVPEPGPGDVLVRNIYLSCDPYLVGRIQSVFPLGEPVAVRAVGVIARSENPAWLEGTIVWGFLAWEEYTLVPGGRGLTAVDPTLGPISSAISVLGMPGLTAYVGTLELGQPKPGETFYVSSAAGAVGSLAGQLARLAGARVVGSAGSPAKCAHVIDKLGFDACFDHRAVSSVGEGLDQHCPEGVDVYFDNVGGETLDAVLARLNPHARIAVCGQISTYVGQGAGLPNIMAMLRQRATMTGFSIYDHTHKLPEFLPWMSRLLREGNVVYVEDVREGIDSVPDAFVGMLAGDNIGKRLVRVSDDPTTS